MSLYIAELKADDARRAAEVAKQARADSLVAEKAARDRLRPLGARAAALLGTIPLERQRQGLSIAELRPLLRGRQRPGCHAGELAGVLRAAGWSNRRSWWKGRAAPSLWYPLEV